MTMNKKELELNKRITEAVDREINGEPLTTHEKSILLIDYKEIYGNDEMTGNIDDDYTTYILDL